MNNKGFTMVELLATITILGILTITAVIAYTRYLDKSKVKSHDTLAKSAYHAAINYYMEHPLATESISIRKLVEDDYLESDKDTTGEKSCKGIVTKESTTTTPNALDEDNYSVELCCANYNYTYSFPGGSKTHNTTCSID